MAAFENAHAVAIRPHTGSVVDYRLIRLPSIPPDGGYDPRTHRAPQTYIHVWMAYFNMIRAGFGPGVLGVPLAVGQTGTILGPLLTLSTGVLVIHSHLMLLNSLNEVSKRLRIPYISYRYGFRLALLHGPPVFHGIARQGPKIIAIFMLLSQVGICTVFVDLTGDSLRDIMDWRTSKSAILVLLLPYLCMTYFTETLKFISYISMIGNFMCFLGLIMIFYIILSTPSKEVKGYTTECLPLIYAFGTLLFNASSVAVVLTLDKALVNPEVMVSRFGVIKVGMIIPTVVVTCFGLSALCSFGPMDDNVLRSLPFDDIVAMIAIGLYSLAVAFTYPIQCFPAIAMIAEVYKHHSPFHEPSPEASRWVKSVARPLFVLLTFVIAYIVPFQSPLVGFVGNLCTTMLAVVFPAMMELSLMYPGPYGKFNIYLVKNILIIVLGTISWMSGVLLIGHLIYVRFMSSESVNVSDFF